MERQIFGQVWAIALRRQIQKSAKNPLASQRLRHHCLLLLSNLNCNWLSHRRCRSRHRPHHSPKGHNRFRIRTNHSKLLNRTVYMFVVEPTNNKTKYTSSYDRVPIYIPRN